MKAGRFGGNRQNKDGLCAIPNNNTSKGFAHDGATRGVSAI